MERESLKRQSETFQREVSGHGMEQSKLRGRIHELERELAVVKGQNEEASHRAQVQLSDLKLEMTRHRGELEKDRDKLSNMVEGERLINDFFFFFCVPQLHLWGSPFLGEIFAYVTVF